MRQGKLISVPFPMKGINTATARHLQDPSSSINLTNVRAFDVDGIIRGGSRPGLSKWSSAILGAAGRVQALNFTLTAASGSVSQSSLLTRTITPVGVNNGKVYKLTTTTATVANGSDTVRLNASAPVIFSAYHNGYVYFVDGSYTVGAGGPPDNSLSKGCIRWTPSSNVTAGWPLLVTGGSLPYNSSGGTDYYPRLICNWRNRIVLSGIQTDAHNWFMSKMGDALDWNTSPSTVTEEQAVSGNTPEIGKLQQPITALIPYSDDLLVFGADHSIWQMTGDPMAGGRLDLVTDRVGMAWGEAWCTSPTGTLYFFGSRGGVHKMNEGGMPEDLSTSRFGDTLNNINLSTNIIRMAWDDHLYGVHIFITPLTAGASYHYFYDERLDAFFRDKLPNSMNPVSVLTIEGDAFADRELILGGEDGYIRKFSDSATSDDGTAFTSEVVFGPFVLDSEVVPAILNELSITLGDDADSVTLLVFAEDSAAKASNPLSFILAEDGTLLLDQTGWPIAYEDSGDADVKFIGTFTGFRSYTQHVRIRGYAFYVMLSASSDQQWAMEGLRLRLNAITSSRGRRL